LKTPLGNVLFFLRLLEKCFNSKNPAELAKCLGYFKVIFAQAMLMQTFVDDLLDLKQIKEGVMSLFNKVFDPNEVFELVHSIFSQQAAHNQTSLTFEIYSYL